MRPSEPAHWAEIRRAFDELIELDPAARAERLTAIGRSDPAARRRLEPLSGENTTATAIMGVAAEVFARAGEHDTAFELLELLLAMPAGREVSVALLRLDPAFAPLRTSPRYDQMIDRFSRN